VEELKKPSHLERNANCHRLNASGVRLTICTCDRGDWMREIYYLFLAFFASIIAAAVLVLEHRGDPAKLERDYSMGLAKRKARGEGKKPGAGV
jgi:hypothetical protein